MCESNHFHQIEIDGRQRTLTIYRVFEDKKVLVTSTKLPEKSWDEDPHGIRDFCRELGENIIMDSPQARKALSI
jgi:hypothetical protein